jgi:hypothetical protein
MILKEHCFPLEIDLEKLICKISAAPHSWLTKVSHFPEEYFHQIMTF